MLSFEHKFNKEQEDENKKVVYFACHREGHTIHHCFQLFSHLKNEEDEGRQRPQAHI
jgi:Zn-finger protein